ncbi:hypothetical protein IC582_021227 [Cucumis melo]
MFRLDEFALLLKSTPVLCQVGLTVDIKSTPKTLTLMLTHHSPRFVAALQMSNEFFNLFYCDETLHLRFSLEKFYVLMYQMELQAYSLMHFTLLPELHAVFLTFEDYNSGQKPRITTRQLDMLPYKVDQQLRIDYKAFVSIDSKDFKRVVLEISAHSSVYVILSDSEAKFSNENKEIIFTKEERKCIIGGIKRRKEYEFVITLDPLLFFLDLSYQAQRVWLFMQKDLSSILVFPSGLWTQFWVYFCP